MHNEYHLIFLKEYNYSDQKRFLMPNTSHTIISTTGNIEISDFDQYLWLTMYFNTRVTVNTVVNVYADTSIATIENCLVVNNGFYVFSIGHVELN